MGVEMREKSRKREGDDRKEFNQIIWFHIYVGRSYV